MNETTQQAISERRLRTLSDLGAATAHTGTPDEVCVAAARTLEQNKGDVPFALIYLADRDTKTVRLAASAGIECGSRAAPTELSLDSAEDESIKWPVGKVLRTGRALLVGGLDDRFGPLPGGLWPESPNSAWLIPLSGHEGRAGVLVAGLSPRRINDAEYRSFFDLVAGHVASAIANAHAIEAERRRAATLAEINRAKTAFFSNVSHEFRTPLTLILGPLEDALSASGTAGELHPLRMAHRNAMRLLRLVNSLLDFSRIEAGRVQASFEPVDLPQFTKELASTFESLMKRAGLHFTIECDPLNEPAYVDREMWEKIVLNLISNAFKFTLEGAVSVKLRRAGDGVELSVRDTGCGIAERELPRLFERFHRIEGTRSRTHEGSGIGLALVHELVKMHGGEIRVTSTVGEGSNFTVSIPTGFAHLPRDRIGAVRTQASTAPGAAAFVDEASRWLGDEELAASLARAEFGEAIKFAESQRHTCILLADDNADMRDYVKRLLEPHYRVETAADGVEALRIARSNPPDLVLTDVMMPNLDGFGLLRELRNDPRTRSIPVIMLSARAGEEARVEGLERGADDYLIKPFSARELIARVASHIDLHRLRLAAREERERLALAFRNASVGIAITDAHGNFVDVNPAYCTLTGYSPDELVGRNIQSITHRDDLPRTLELVERMQSGEDPGYNLEKRYLRKDGSEVWVQVNVAAVRDAAGDPVSRIVVAENITARKHAEYERRALLQRESAAREEAERARTAADEANRAKDEFLAMLGHELRNPLSPILTALRIIRLRGDTANAHELAVIERQVNLLTELVDDLLDVSRVTRGKIQLRKQRVEMAAIVASAIEMASPLIDQRGHHLEIAVPKSGLMVEGDPTRLAQIVSNLLTNAAKYTNPGGRIEVRAGRDGGEIVLCVRDNGIGIRADLLPRVFDLFLQGSRTLNRAEGGLGIGLALVKNLVRLHGGTVTAHSEGSGKGSEFIVRLPAAVQRQTVSPATPEEPASSVMKDAPRRILIVDDNKDAAETLAELLDAHGHMAKALFDAPSALETAPEFKPDVMLVDIGLPVMNGYELARKLRRLPATASTRLIAITGYGQESDRRRAEEAGFDAHIVKPVDLARLRALLRPGNGDARS